MLCALNYKDAAHHMSEFLFHSIIHSFDRYLIYKKRDFLMANSTFFTAWIIELGL